MLKVRGNSLLASTEYAEIENGYMFLLYLYKETLYGTIVVTIPY